MKNLDLSNIEGLDESITENYTNYCGDDDYSNANWFQDAVKSIKDAGKDAGKNIKDTTKDIGKNIKNTTKDAVKSIKDAGRDAGKNKNLKNTLKAAFLTYNPAVAIPRSSALLAFRVNLFGVSSRLYPAFLDEESLKKGNFNLENAERAKKAWEDVANFWEDKIGGDRNKLREAISGAWNKPVFKTKKSQARKRSTGFDGGEFSNVAGYDDAAIAAYIAAGLSIIGGIVGMLGKKGVSKNPYNDGSPEAQGFDTQQGGAGTMPPLSQAELDKIIAAAKADKEKGLGLDSTGIDLQELNEGDVVNEDGSITRKSGKILGIPKTAFWIGVGVLGLVAGIVIYKKFIKK